MWTLSKQFHFEAAHILPYHEGKCARLHGHSWGLTVECAHTRLHTTGPQRGMVIDYGSISEAVRPLLEAKLDHWYLNETTGLESPTSEALALWVYTQLKPALPLLRAITITETCTSACRYTEKA